MVNTHIVIMAGGVGSRLYPLSTPEHPKQFLDLLGTGKTMLEMTVERFLSLAPIERIWVVTSKEYVHFVKEQVPGILPAHILAEPCARNTAPCISYATRRIFVEDPDAAIVVSPADAYVPCAEAFAATVRAALDHAAAKGGIVCLGISPTRPATEYGYIKIGSKAVPDQVTKVSSFKEKPDLETARAYLEDGSYLWNAGIFVWKAKTVESELRTHVPSIEEIMDKIEPFFNTEDEEKELAENFPLCEKISIDYAVMEKSQSVYVAPSGWEWSDLGSFKELEKFKKTT